MEILNSLPSKKVHATLVHNFGDVEAYIVGGREATDCLVFDILNQKFKVLAKLNHERINCGAFKTGNYIYTFGGDGAKSTYWEPQIPESIERLDLNNNQGFEEVKI